MEINKTCKHLPVLEYLALIDFCIQLIVILFSFVLGVDVVLNSLSEEKLQASLQVLAQHGRFLEIGKYDLSNNTGLGTQAN